MSLTSPSTTARVLVVLAGRGALPFTTLHGAPLYHHALAAARHLGADLLVDPGHGQRGAVDHDLLPAGCRLLTPDDWWATRGAGPVLLHDALCPLAPADFLTAMADRAAARPAASAAAVRPVTDTLKTVLGDQIEGTIDRDRIATVVSPLLLGAAALDALDGPPPFEDFAALVALARKLGDVELVRAPSVARRVADESSVHLLESVVEMSRQLRP
ncbi:MAG: hypothetical protein U0R80_02680 [Nocardioidaceae bacterium]